MGYISNCGQRPGFGTWAQYNADSNYLSAIRSHVGRYSYSLPNR